MKNRQILCGVRKGRVLTCALAPVVAALLLSAAGSAYGQQTITYSDGQNNVNPIAITADLTPTTLFIDSGSATQSGAISESGVAAHVTKDGAGLLVLDADNTYIGGTTVDAGTLQLGTGTTPRTLSALAGTDSIPAVTVNSAATFAVDLSSTVAGSGASSAEPVLIANGVNGGIGVQVNAGGTLVNQGSIHAGDASPAGFLFGNGGTGGAGVVLANGAANFSNGGSIAGGKGTSGGEQGNGGNGGTGATIAAAGTFSNSGSINGSTGGNGGLITGNGGDGGMGVLITAAATFSNSGSIVGAAGGNGGAAAPIANGGNGGQGVLMTSGGTLTNAISGSVVGGSAGAAGVVGQAGASAAAVELTAGGTVNNSGTISGNRGVVFSGAAGTLTNSGTITGGVAMGDFPNQVTLFTGGKIVGDLDISSNTQATLTLSGSGAKTFSAAVTGTTVFAGSLAKQGAGKWTLDQSMNYAGTTSINAGTLALTGSTTIPNSPTITVAGPATFDVSGLTTVFNLGQSQTLTGAGMVLGNLNVAGTLTGSTTITGDVALSSTGRLKGSTTIAGTLAGSGQVDPGNSPGLVTAGQVDPSAGIAFNFELTKQGAPDFADPSNIANDVLRLTHDDPFASALSPANTINLYLSAAAFSGGSADILGGFFTDSEPPADLAADLDNSLLHVFIADPTGTTTYNGQTYSPLDRAQYNVGFTAVSQAAQFGAATVNGAITDLRITTVPEPLSAGAGAALLGALACCQRPRRRKLAP